MRRAAVLSILVASVSGCANEGSTEGLAQGLTVLEAEPGSLSLAYRDADDVIFMQALRGQRTPDIYQGVEGMPEFEVDARFVDDEGRAFHTRRGGDLWIEPQWAEELREQAEGIAPNDSNERQWNMAGDVAPLLRAAIEEQLGPDAVTTFAPEIDALLEFAEPAAAAYATRRQRTLDVPTVPTVFGPDGDVTYGTDGPEDPYWWEFSGNYVWEMDVHRSNIVADGWHSATAVWGRSGTTWYYFHSSCNHGGCATSITFNCTLATSAVNNTTWIYPTCLTGYSWTSNDGHNCHDDTRDQLRAMALGQPGDGYVRWCDNDDHASDISHWPGDQGGSPSCNSNTTRGYGY